MEATTDRRPAAESVRDPAVIALLVAGVAYFASSSVGFPVIPRLVERELGGGEAEVGLVFGVQALGMLAARPFAGYLGDRFGRRALMVFGASVGALTQLLHFPAARLGGLLGLLVVRVLFGLAASLMYVGQATVATEIGTPRSRGPIFATFSSAVFGGFALGPVLGESMLDSYGFSAAFGAAAGCSALCAIVGLALPETRPAGTIARFEGLSSMIHPAAYRIGLLNLLAMVSFLSFNAFITPYAERFGAEQTAWLLFTFSFTVLVLRATGGRRLDTGNRMAIGTFATSCIVVAGVILATASGVAALYLGAFVLAGGLAFNVPLMVLVGADSAPPKDRARVVSTIVLFGDIANSAGSLVLGGVADIAGYRVMYAMVAACGAAALVLLRSPFVAGVPGLRRSSVGAYGQAAVDG